MIPIYNVADRIPVWKALAGLYLDAELRDSHYRHIAHTLYNSPYSLEEIRAIDKYEVFPVLHVNVLGPGGEYIRFDEAWLLEKIITRHEDPPAFARVNVNLLYLGLGRLFRKGWKRVAASYHSMELEQGWSQRKEHMAVAWLD
jgi:hypothetical protein